MALIILGILWVEPSPAGDNSVVGGKYCIFDELPLSVYVYMYVQKLSVSNWKCIKITIHTCKAWINDNWGEYYHFCKKCQFW